MYTSSLVHESVLRHLALMATQVQDHSDELKEELAQIPVSVIDASLDMQMQSNWSNEDRLRLLQLLALDPRDYIRVQVAAHLAHIEDPLPPEGERLLQDLCADPSIAVRQTAAASLAAVLQHSEGFTRTRVVGAWALSNLRAQRAAIAQALRWPFAVMGAASAVELLSSDDDAEVRAAAAEAAKLRLKDTPGLCGAILKRLSEDPDPTVRRAAKPLD